MTIELSTLNDVQRRAVETAEGPLLILAGAGSGKTRVLTHKVAHLIENRSVPRHAILAFTFTNKAASEMAERIARLLGGATTGLWIGTFHATCVRILRQHAEAAGLRRGFSIYDRDDSITVVKRVVRAHNLSDQEFRPRAVLERISSAKGSLVTPAELRASAQTRWDDLLADLYAAYESELAEKGALDFDDLLVRALRLLTEVDEVGEAFARRFRYVLVDEYQDTNKVQFELTSALASHHRNLTVVGDDDQSIYGWRGADITNILDFESVYPDATVLRLEQNYRSTGNILSAANAVVAHNEGRKPKTLWTENPAGDLVTLTVAPDEEREAEEVIRKARELNRHENVSYWDIAVLYRTNAQSRPLEEVCLRHRIPYRIVGGVAFFQRREVKDVIAYLKLAANPLDAIAFERAVGVPRRGIGKVSLERVLREAAAFEGDIVRACVEAPVAASVSGKAAEELRRFGDLISRIQAFDETVAANEVLEFVVRESGLWEGLVDQGAESASRREHVEELVSSAEHFALRAETPGFRAYLEESALRTDLDAWDPGEDCLTLMTVHNAKGLEFDVVFVAGLEEGLFPHGSSLDSPEDVEEERRLFYVALTRARHQAFVSAAIERRRMNRFEAATPSRFVDEIPETLLRKQDPFGLGLSSGRFSARVKRARRTTPFTGGSGASDTAHGAVRRHRPPASASVPVTYEEPSIDVNDDRVQPGLEGRIVWHAKYGRGVVLKQDGTGESAKCEVRFMGQMTRKIVAKFLDAEDDTGA